MKNMTLANIASCLGSTLIGGAGKEQLEITGAVLDSRKVEPGYLFFATKGARVDGHSFIPQVAERGAALIVCEKAPTVEIPYILVEDSFAALKKLAMFYRAQLTLPIVGVTGSVGKTSTKEMIAACLGKKFHVLKTEGNFNNEIGLPLTILRIRKEHEAAVLEMGINHFGEMTRLSEIARPDICVITNIGQCHLENLIDRDGILRAKSEIFIHMQQDGYVVLNGDDDKLATVQEVHGRKPVFFGMEDRNDVYASDVETLGLFGSRFKLHMPCSKELSSKNGGFNQKSDKESCENPCPGSALRAAVPLPGHHMVVNALAAAAVGRILGMTEEDVLEGIASVQATSGRSNIMKLTDKTVIDDCYNANPVSMRSAIDLLMMAEGPKAVILGDMFELGAEEKALHREIGHCAALARLDRRIFIGELAKEMYEGAKMLRTTPEYYPDKEAFFAANSPADFAGMTVLVKASHGMHFEDIVKWLK